MKFLLGLLVGAKVSPHFYRIIEKRYGHIIIPWLQNFADNMEHWARTQEPEEDQ